MINFSAICDFVLFLALISIAISLAVLIRKHGQQDKIFSKVLWLFVFSITFCGLDRLFNSHLFESLNNCFLVLVKAIAAIVSLLTVIILGRAISKILQSLGCASARTYCEFIVQSTSDAIITYDIEGYCKSWNRGAEKMFGYSADEVAGKNLKFLMPHYKINLEEIYHDIRTHQNDLTHLSNQDSPCHQDDQVVRPGHGIQIHEFECAHKSGQKIKVMTTYSKLMNSQNDTIGICTITKELTSQKELEDQLAAKAKLLTEKAQLLSQQNKKLNKLNRDLKIKNEETNSFAYAASHDLKSPLRIITNFSHLLYEGSREKLDQESLTLLKTIQTQAIQMGVFINDLSAYLQLGSEDYTYQHVDCTQIIVDIVASLDKPQGFQIEIDSHLEPIYAPRIPLQIVLQNLIVNAVIHHQSDQGYVKITAEQIQEKIIFRIKDDGLGIAAIYHEKIFDMFQTLKPREETGGSGIGLSLVKRVLQRYGGSIKLYSCEGKGSIFEVIWRVPSRETK